MNNKGTGGSFIITVPGPLGGGCGSGEVVVNIPTQNGHGGGGVGGYEFATGSDVELMKEENKQLRARVAMLEEALKTILGWRELRDTMAFPVERIEEIANRALSLSTT